MGREGAYIQRAYNRMYFFVYRKMGNVKYLCFFLLVFLYEINVRDGWKNNTKQITKKFHLPLMKLVYHLSNLSKRLRWNYYWKANNEMLPYKYHHILKKQRKKKNPLKYNNSTWKTSPSPPPPPSPYIYTNLLTNGGILRSYNLNYFRLETQLLNLEKYQIMGKKSNIIIIIKPSTA